MIHDGFRAHALFVSGVTLAASLTISTIALAGGQPCTQVTATALNISGLEITGSKLQDAGDGLPMHCIVTGVVNERTGADGKSYAIRFEMRLPTEWNGRFLHQVNGGNDGVLLIPILLERGAA